MLRVTTPQHSPVLVDRQRGAEPFLVAGDRVGVLHQLLVEDVHDRLAGDVGDVVGAGGRGAAEGPGAQLPLGVAVEGHPEVLEVEDLLRCLAAHDLDRVLVGEVVGALDRVEGVGLPGVLGVERRVDPALRGVGVRAHRMDLADDPDRDAVLGGGEGRALSGEAGSDDQDVVGGHESDPIDRASRAGHGRATPAGPKPAQRAALPVPQPDAPPRAPIGDLRAPPPTSVGAAPPHAGPRRSGPRRRRIPGPPGGTRSPAARAGRVAQRPADLLGGDDSR